MLLAFGAFAGIGSGIASHARHAHQHHRRAMQHVARVCVEASRDLDRQQLQPTAIPQVIYVQVPTHQVPTPQPPRLAP